MNRFLSPLIVGVLILFGAPTPASAQTADAVPKGWSFDAGGLVGVTPGIGRAATGLDLTASASLVRTTFPASFTHKCFGVTAMFSGIWANAPNPANREQVLLVGPRWDAGDPDGALSGGC